jgi:hypothetical protein
MEVVNMKSLLMNEQTLLSIEKQADIRVDFKDGVLDSGFVRASGTPVYIDNDLEFNEVREVSNDMVGAYLTLVANRRSTYEQ